MAKKLASGIACAAVALGAEAGKLSGRSVPELGKVQMQKERLRFSLHRTQNANALCVRCAAKANTEAVGLTTTEQ